MVLIVLQAARLRYRWRSSKSLRRCIANIHGPRRFLDVVRRSRVLAALVLLLMIGFRVAMIRVAIWHFFGW